LAQDCGLILLRQSNFIYYSVEQSVKDDIAIITSSPYMRKELAERTKGFTYNIKTGLLSPV